MVEDAYSSFESQNVTYNDNDNVQYFQVQCVVQHAYDYCAQCIYKHVRQHIAPKNTAHCHYNCMTHSMTQKSYRKHPLPQNTRHVSYTRKAYHSRVNKFENVECFYCMTKGHTSNVCFYRKLHLNMLPLDYLETNQPRPRKVWVQKNV